MKSAEAQTRQRDAKRLFDMEGPLKETIAPGAARLHAVEQRGWWYEERRERGDRDKVQETVWNRAMEGLEISSTTKRIRWDSVHIRSVQLLKTKCQ